MEAFELRQAEESLPKVRLTWKATKTELTELLFALDSRKVFGDVPLTRLSEYVQRAFNIELDKNLSRTFGDLRIRNRQTPFLDSLKAALLRRMNRPLNKPPRRSEQKNALRRIRIE